MPTRVDASTQVVKRGVDVPTIIPGMTDADHPLRHRLQRIFDELDDPEGNKWTQRSLSKAIGRSPGYIHSVFKKAKDPDEIGHAIIADIAETVGVSMRWLSQGYGPMRLPRDEADAVQISSLREIVPPGYIRLMQFGEEVGAGAGIDNHGEGVEVLRHVDIAQWWAAKNLPKNTDNIRIMGVRGDSMHPLINDGDIVFVDTSVQFYRQEGIYVFTVAGHAMLKRLSIEALAKRLVLKSENPAYGTEYLPASEIDDLHVMGLVVAWWTLRKA